MVREFRSGVKRWSSTAAAAAGGSGLAGSQSGRAQGSGGSNDSIGHCAPTVQGLRRSTRIRVARPWRRRPGGPFGDLPAISHKLSHGSHASCSRNRVTAERRLFVDAHLEGDARALAAAGLVAPALQHRLSQPTIFGDAAGERRGLASGQMTHATRITPGPKMGASSDHGSTNMSSGAVLCRQVIIDSEERPSAWPRP